MAVKEPYRLNIAIGTSNLGRVKNLTLTWRELVQKLSTPVVTTERFDEFLKLPLAEQDRLKNVGGFWIAGYCRDGRRASTAITFRSAIALDLDDAPADILDRLELGLTGISHLRHCWHTTRKHTAEKPRVRIVIFLSKPCRPEEYMALARIVASWLDPTMDMIDDVSFRLAQMMYLPSHSIDGEFVCGSHEGEHLDPEAVLKGFPTWQDFKTLPFSTKQGQKRPGQKKAEDPREKPGIIGAFCRAYDIEEAIAKFIPDVYSPGDTETGGKPRYTYNYGSTTNGAVVEDDGLFLYSHHTTDPVSDRLVNSFDLIRIHKFGDLDPAKVADDAKPSSLPSFKRMMEFLASDDETLTEFSGNLAEKFDDLGDEEGTEVPGEDQGTEVPGYDPDIEELLGERGATPRKKLTPLERMNRKHAMARMKGDTVALTFDADGVSFGSLTDLNTYYANVPMPTPAGGREPISAWWNKHPERRSYPGGVVFAPHGAPANVLNLWRGWAVKPDPNASCKLFLDHIRENICRNHEPSYRYYIGWLAHTVQRPWEKPGVALVLRGVKGAGKDEAGKYFGSLFPHHHITVSQMDQLTGKFNAHHERALMIHVEEGYWAGNPQAVGALNRLITSETTMIERKGYDPIEMPSVARVFITSNADWVVPATAGERRFAVYDVSDRKARDRVYFKAMRDERDNGGRAALLHFLQTYDLTGFDVGVPPETVGLANQKVAGLKNVEGWLYDLLANAELPASEHFTETADWRRQSIPVLSKVLYQSYVDWMRLHHYQGDVLIEEHFFRKLLKIIPKAERRRFGARGQQKWSRCLPRLRDCRQAFSDYLGSALVWLDDEEDDEEDLIG